MVGFTGGQRLLGESAKTQEVMNLRNTVTDIRRMLGRSLAEDDVQTYERPHLLYNVVATDDGSCGATVRRVGPGRAGRCIHAGTH
jgi:heat shock 70kDa protein 4